MTDPKPPENVWMLSEHLPSEDDAERGKKQIVEILARIRSEMKTKGED